MINAVLNFLIWMSVGLSLIYFGRGAKLSKHGSELLIIWGYTAILMGVVYAWQNTEWALTVAFISIILFNGQLIYEFVRGVKHA